MPVYIDNFNRPFGNHVTERDPTPTPTLSPREPNLAVSTADRLTEEPTAAQPESSGQLPDCQADGLPLAMLTDPVMAWSYGGDRWVLRPWLTGRMEEECCREAVREPVMLPEALLPGLSPLVHGPECASVPDQPGLCAMDVAITAYPATIMKII